jgi:hypothetical protein
LVVYAVESFLRRLALSAYADRIMLKDGMLMAASDIRRMTKDADLSAHGMPSDEQRMRHALAEICALDPEPHDGVTFDVDRIRIETMREGDEYQGVRCS